MTSNARHVIDTHMSEKDFQQQIIDLALRTGWMVFHPYDMRRSREGYPDLTMVHPGRGVIMFAELKRESKRAVLSDNQYEWFTALAVAARQINWSDYSIPRDLDLPSVYVVVWKPSDWPEIVRIVANQAGADDADS